MSSIQFVGYSFFVCFFSYVNLFLTIFLNTIYIAFYKIG